MLLTRDRPRQAPVKRTISLIVIVLGFLSLTQSGHASPAPHVELIGERTVTEIVDEDGRVTVITTEPGELILYN
jgi:hypothetical protein